jgi:predicted ABC-type transport system involved in lysophospholipase L1 biosynthesis ATPase subunit
MTHPKESAKVAIEVKNIVKQVDDATGHLTILNGIDFTAHAGRRLR